jgi:hypothetical protein
MTQVFEDDLKRAHRTRSRCGVNRSLSERLAEKFIRPIKSQL